LENFSIGGRLVGSYPIKEEEFFGGRGGKGRGLPRINSLGI